jgi:hypothetical protein
VDVIGRRRLGDVELDELGVDQGDAVGKVADHVAGPFPLQRGPDVVRGGRFLDVVEAPRADAANGNELRHR